MLIMTLKWKEAASVILTSLKGLKDKSNFNYDVLSMKRSVRNSFMPGTFVFPGGAYHPADGNEKWMEIFCKFDLNLNNEMDEDVTPAILKNNNCQIPKLIAMKITAIREAFEEIGVLLCKKENETYEWATCLYDINLHSWRSKVGKNAFEFLNLCKHFNCYPDINNLHLWSNWLTPKSNKIRFDTLFFVASLAEKPISSADKVEIDDIVWSTPKKLLEQNNKDILVLPPPQIYETSRLLNFKTINDLLNFAKQRASYGCERWMPEQIKVLDGMVSLLPGDDAYSEDIFEGNGILPSIVELTKDEFCLKYKKLHRIQAKKIIIKDYHPKNGHILPLSLKDF